VETPHRLGCHRTKIASNSNVLAYSKSPWTGADMHIWIYEQKMPSEKVPGFLKSHPCRKKNRQWPFPCSYPLHNWLLYSWKVSASASIVTTYNTIPSLEKNLWRIQQRVNGRGKMKKCVERNFGLVRRSNVKPEIQKITAHWQNVSATTTWSEPTITLNQIDHSFRFTSSSSSALRLQIQVNGIPFTWVSWYGVAMISRLLKIIVSFVKEPYKRDDIQQKRPIIWRSLLIEATP